jgi:site-specific DNA recombinase
MSENSRGTVRVEPGRKRVRTYLNGELVADTRTPFLVWEHPYYPTYYLPAADVRAALIDADETEHSPSRGDAEILHVKVATATAERAARRYPDSPLEQLRSLVRIDWNAMTEWLEEDDLNSPQTIQPDTLEVSGGVVPAPLVSRLADLGRLPRREAGPMRALGAVRLSNLTDETTSPARQREQITGYAGIHGHTVIHITEDLDVSGATSPFDRDDLGPWLTDPEKIKLWDCLIVAKLDRLTRSLRDFDDFREWCDQHGKTFMSVSESIDLTTPTGRMFANLLAMFAQFQRERTAELRAEAADTIRKAGRWGGGVVPFGYEAYKDGAAWYLRTCDDTCPLGLNLAAETAAMAGEVIKGIPVQQIVAGLNERGVPTSSDAQRMHAAYVRALADGQTPGEAQAIALAAGKGKRWGVTTILLHLKSESAMGYVLHYKKGEPPRKVYVDGVPLKREPLIDPETWEAVQAALEGRSAPWNRAGRRSSLITGIGFCTYCGAALRGDRTVKYPGKGIKRNVRHDGATFNHYYKCANMRDRAACPHSLSIPMDKLDAAVDAALAARFGSEPFRARVEKPGRSSRRQIDKVERAIRELDFDDPQFITRQSELLAERARLQKMPFIPAEVAVEADGRTVAEAWMAMDKDTKRRYLASRGIKVYAFQPAGGGDPVCQLEGGTWRDAAALGGISADEFLAAEAAGA